MRSVIVSTAIAKTVRTVLGAKLERVWAKAVLWWYGICPKHLVAREIDAEGNDVGCTKCLEEHATWEKKHAEDDPEVDPDGEGHTKVIFIGHLWMRGSSHWQQAALVAVEYGLILAFFVGLYFWNRRA